MPNYTQTRNTITQFLTARVPLIVVHSIEPNRVLSILRDIAANFPNMPFFEYSGTEGLTELLSKRKVSEDPSLHGALDMAKQTFKTRANVNYIFSDIDTIDADSTTSRHFAQMVRLSEQYQGSIILLVDKPVWPGLSRLGMSTTLDLPDIEELYDALSETIESNRMNIIIEWQHEEIRRAAETLLGVTESEAINVLATLLAKGKIARSDLAELSQFKDRIFGEMTGIERITLREDYTIGGLATLKSWLTKREVLIKSDLSATALHPPKGILLCGVPGCGKSLSAKAIAHQWQLPLYRLDMGSVLGMYVGESEKNLREALATADRVAPCVLWIDEIEKGLANSASDSSVTKRLIGQFLYWLQESTSKVFLVATANDVSTLPPELLRKGRFDEVFFVDLPTAEEREEILRLSFIKYIQQCPSPEMLAELTAVSEGFAGSDIDAAVHDIASEMFAHRSSTLPDDDYIAEVFRNVVPFSQSNPEEVEAIRQWGRTRAVPAGSTTIPTPLPPQHNTPRRVLF
ncbi:MAG: AAA family ATPase [Corynebacterium sp.]|uniref:AAA family ATPase n=1 Tax=Corynebacterium sp. TaxID=1720 RepID=UPI0026DD212B|nr:AAA family ATPase [Corynebacterium sp.]MDO4761609.1 AAA family ATPase [Corynebacterium sp.]